jgi:thiol-disulfide isomerase/thioredoxin
MVSGLVALAVVLAAASAVGVLMRHREGRLRPVREKAVSMSGTPAAGSPAASDPSDAVLTPADLGTPLGERATLVQFSTEVCAYCRPTREMLAEVAGSREGVRLVEIDAAERIDLARRLRVYTTPTVLVLGPDGTITRRSAGRPRKAEVLAAVGDLLGEGGSLEFPT